MNQATAVCRRHSQQVGRCAIMDDEMSRRPRTASARARTKVVAASLAQTRGCFSPLPPPLSRLEHSRSSFERRQHRRHRCVDLSNSFCRRHDDPRI